MNLSTALALALFATTVSTAAPSIAATRAAGPVPAFVALAPSLVLKQVPGSYHVAVSGRALASTPLFLTLLGTVSPDVPDVIVSRNRVVTDAAGNFKLEISPAGDYFREGLLTMVVTSPSGAILAKQQIVLKAPNFGVPVPNEERLQTET